MSTTAITGNPGGQDPESEYGQDTVKVFSHEGDGENTEHLNSMDLHDVKTELERDAEKAEVSVFSIVGHCIQMLPLIPPHHPPSVNTLQLGLAK